MSNKYDNVEEAVRDMLFSARQVGNALADFEDSLQRIVNLFPKESDPDQEKTGKAGVFCAVEGLASLLKEYLKK